MAFLPEPESLIRVFAFLFGAVIGSFLNVCIYRLPLHLSIVRPRSACPACGALIPAYHNVPLLSYIVLRGRCAKCRTAISPRYFIVELLSAVLSLALMVRYGPTFAYGAYFVFAAALLVITYIDLDHQIIPDRISLPGIAVGLALAALGPVLPARLAGNYEVTLAESALGLVAGAGGLFAIAYGYLLLTGREGMGLGDVKLLGMIGTFIGWQGVLLTLFLGSLFGTLIATPLVIARGEGRHAVLPFGPFLALGALTALLFGDVIIAAYFHLSDIMVESAMRATGGPPR
ncbi:MAG: prepilin peptidase [Candidatus Schekmanbacteria bacterium]|nr:prepilin peptidase [Candidatus Schekmanbacteria bacterium]